MLVVVVLISNKCCLHLNNIKMIQKSGGLKVKSLEIMRVYPLFLFRPKKVSGFWSSVGFCFVLLGGRASARNNYCFCSFLFFSLFFSAPIVYKKYIHAYFLNLAHILKPWCVDDTEGMTSWQRHQISHNGNQSLIFKKVSQKRDHNR